MLCLPGYRYCGLGCSGPGAPLNKLDVYCMQHDACYRSNTPNRRCDEAFLRNLEPYLQRSDKMGRDATLMYRVMKFKQLF